MKKKITAKYEKLIQTMNQAGPFDIEPMRLFAEHTLDSQWGEATVKEL